MVRHGNGGTLVRLVEASDLGRRRRPLAPLLPQWLPGQILCLVFFLSISCPFPWPILPQVLGFSSPRKTSCTTPRPASTLPLCAHRRCDPRRLRRGARVRAPPRARSVPLIRVRHRGSRRRVHRPRQPRHVEWGRARGRSRSGGCTAARAKEAFVGVV